MPVFEMLLKDISYLILWLKNYISNGFKNKTMLVYPHYPSRGSTIYKVGKHLKFNITNKPSKKIDIAVYWEYLTHREEFQLLEKLSKQTLVLNLHSRNISKLYVDGIHQEVFGYCTAVDPLTYNGPMVQKNDINAMHDGKVVNGPLTKVEPGFIYQLLIDNTHGKDHVEDIRVPIINGTLDFAYRKYRVISSRFKDTTGEPTPLPIQELLSTEEIKLIDSFSKKMQLDYGELDVLRHKGDGKIYIVDVNNTAQGPPKNISKENAKVVIKKMAARFQQEFMK